MPTNSTKRRLALKTLGGSALAGSLADKLPAIWQRPLVESAALPAHAQVSAEMGQIRLVVGDNSGRRESVTVSLTYRVQRNANDRITQVTFPSGTAMMAADEPHAPALWQSLFPAAYAQVTNPPEVPATLPVVQPPPPPRPSSLRLIRDLALDFTGGRMQQSGDLSLSYDGFTCLDFEVQVTLIPDRTGIRRIDAGTERTNCGTAYQITADTSPGSGFGYVIAPTPIPRTVPPTDAPAQTTLPPLPPETVEGQIGLVVTDTGGMELVTMMFNYRVQRDRSNRIDTIRLPATAVQMAMHQPASRVLEILFPTAQAQANELHLAQEVVLMFSDEAGGLTDTAMLPLRYDDTDCTGTFDVTVELYPGRIGIQSIMGSSNISQCGSVNVAIEAGAGFGTMPPPPTPGPTTTASGPTGTPGPTTTPEPTTTAAPTVPPTTVQITSIGFMEPVLSVLEGNSVNVVVTVSGRAEVTFDIVRTMGPATGTDLAGGTPLAGVALDTDGDNYNLTGITVPAGAGSITIPLMAASDTISEGTETLTFELRNPDAAAQGDVAMIDPANNQVMITIADADKPLVQFAQDEYQVLEGDTIDIEFDIQGWEYAPHKTEHNSGDSQLQLGFLVSRVNPTDTAITNDFRVDDFGGDDIFGTVQPLNAANANTNDDPASVRMVLIQARQGGRGNNALGSIIPGSSSDDVDSPAPNEGGVRFRFTASTDAVAEGQEEVMFRIDQDANTAGFTYDGLTYRNSDIRVGPISEVTIRIFDNPIVRWEMPAYSVTEPEAGVVTDNSAVDSFMSVDVKVVFEPRPSSLPDVYFRVLGGDGVVEGDDIHGYNAGDDYELYSGTAAPNNPPVTAEGALFVLDSRDTQTIRIYRDRLREGNEIVTLTLAADPDPENNPGNSSSYTVDADNNQTVITLIDNPPPPPPPTTMSPTTTPPPTAGPTTTGEATTTVVSIPTGEQWYEWTWGSAASPVSGTGSNSSNTYYVIGEFRTSSTNTSLVTADISFHQLEVYENGALLYSVGLTGTGLFKSASGTTTASTRSDHSIRYDTTTTSFGSGSLDFSIVDPGGGFVGMTRQSNGNFTLYKLGSSDTLVSGVSSPAFMSRQKTHQSDGGVSMVITAP